MDWVGSFYAYEPWYIRTHGLFISLGKMTHKNSNSLNLKCKQRETWNTNPYVSRLMRVSWEGHDWFMRYP